MKNIIFILMLNLGFIFTSCERESNNLENDEVESVENIANKYAYKISKINHNDSIYKVNDIAELNTILEVIKNNFNTTKIEKLGNNSKTIEENPKAVEMYNNLFKLQKKGLQNRDGEDPPYTFSTTFYFDNNFPCSNVAVTINYNTNYLGQITVAQVNSTSYGYAFGNTYSQYNVTSHLYNGIFVFSITGQFSSSIGIGNYSVTNVNNAEYYGYIQGAGNGGNMPGMGTHGQDGLVGSCGQRSVMFPFQQTD